MQRYGLFSTLHDGRIFVIHRRNCRSIHGWFFRLS
jgi:hypothetical protein